MSKALANDCFAHDRERLSHAEAIAILKRAARPLVGQERVPIDEAAGRIVAAPICAPRPIPGHDNAAVDGYAFRFEDYDPEQGAQLAIAERAAAGHPLEGRLPPRVAVRIFTGAVMPEGFDTVVMQEDVTVLGEPTSGWVRIPPGLRPGANRRRAGEDVGEGAELVSAGTRLRPQEIAAIASAGHGEVNCYERLRIALFSSGDELLSPGAPFEAGKVYDSNRPMLKALLAESGAVVRDLGLLPDEADEVEARIAEACRAHHLVLTSGGASLGEEDHIVRALDRLGRRDLWQLAIKPGRPMTFGRVEDAVFIGLPGNPVAVFVCYLIYARPLILALSGAPWPAPRHRRLRAAFRVPKKKTGRREFWRGYIRESEDGPVVEKFARDGSGLISSLVAAEGLIEVGEEVSEIREGDEVDFLPFSEFGIVG